MAVSKRLRYEILRRDNHTCRYCGASAPDAKLTVDHVTPRALGGSDDPSNLVAACEPCNTGKTSTNPDAPLVSDVAADALRWARARTAALEAWRFQREELQHDLEAFRERWDAWGTGDGDDRESVPRDSDWDASVEMWLEQGFTIEDLIELIPKAMHSRKGRNGSGVAWGERWRYYCGVVWRTLDQIQADTKASLERPEPPPDDPFDRYGADMYRPDTATDTEATAYNAGYHDGFSAGSAHVRNYSGLATVIELRNRHPRVCIECDDRFEHLATGMCAPCLGLEDEREPV